METIKFAKLYDDVIIPSKREEDAGFDIYARFEEDYIVVAPHETKMIPTGLISAFDNKYVAILKERGSTGTKGMGQRCGIIDSGYRNEWFIPITNHNNCVLLIIKEGVELTDRDYWNISSRHKTEAGLYKIYNKNSTMIIYPYEKAICQALMVEVPKLTIEELTVDEIKAIKSERGEGKLGSSNK